MKTIKIIKNYYDEDFEIFKPNEINIDPGLTVLVGCNGYGKTTFLKILKHQLEKEKIPFINYSDLHDGRRNAFSKAGMDQDFKRLSTLMQSSEGESLIYNFGYLLEKLFSFLQTGENKFNNNPFIDIFKDDDAEEEITTNERWLLIDAIDSGTSIDNIVEIINVLKLSMQHAKQLDKEYYIVISANQYELARNNNCLDVVNGENIKFKDYEEYRNFVLKSLEEKSKRYGTKQRTKRTNKINNDKYCS